MESQTIKYLRLEWFIIVIDRGFDQSSTSTISSMGVFKKGASSKAQPLGRAERTKEYVSTAKWRERRWRHFSDGIKQAVP
jgi:hypothetical protein